MSKHMVIHDGTLIDCVTATAKHHQAVLINGDKIEAIGTVGQMQLPADAVYVDARGRAILPGLIDAHIHITGDGNPDILRQMKMTVPYKAILSTLNAKALVEAGFTSIRDAGGSHLLTIGLREAVKDGLVPGPRMKVSGKGLSITGGHGDNFFPPEVILTDRYVVDGPDEARRAARQQLRDGADCIKLHATGGVMSEKDEPTSRGLTVEEMRAAIEEARNVGAKTLAHAQGNQGIKNAIIAGIDSVDHGCYLDDETIELMLKHGVFMVPTLSAPYNIVVNGEKMGIPEYGVRKTKMVQAAHLASFRKAVDAGVKIAMGTDAATPFNFHGKNAKELELMVEAGMTNAQALLATTRMAAELLGTLDKVGTLEAGKLADIVLVAGDPLADIRVLQPSENISMVVQGGKVVINRGVALGNHPAQ